MAKPTTSQARNGLESVQVKPGLRLTYQKPVCRFTLPPGVTVDAYLRMALHVGLTVTTKWSTNARQDATRLAFQEDVTV
jgi:hypothetical protein